MSLFTNKKAAFFITGPWEYANLKKALGDKMGLMVIPGGKPFVTIESTMLSSTLRITGGTRVYEVLHGSHSGTI